MANHTTGAQRYNARMDKIFATAKVLNAKHDAGRARHVAEKHGDVSSYSSCTRCHGKSDAKSKAIEKKVPVKDSYGGNIRWHLHKTGKGFKGVSHGTPE